MPDQIEQLAEIFKAVSDTTRLRMVKMLAEREGPRLSTLNSQP